MPAAGEESGWDDGEAALERRVKLLALPLALGVCALLAASQGGRFLLRLFCGMWVHEVGHAVTAWACGCLWGGALLMAAVYAPEGSWVRRDWLRFGFLFIGAAAFTDVFSQWWAARTDPERIPFGANEGQGLSDPSRLQETWRWSTDQLVGRYVTLGSVCLSGGALGAVCMGGVQQPRAERVRHHRSRSAGPAAIAPRPAGPPSPRPATPWPPSPPASAARAPAPAAGTSGSSP